MNIKITGKQMTVTEGMRTHLNDKLVKLEHYAPKLLESQVVLKKEKYLFVAEIVVLAKNFRAYGDAKAKDNMFTAMDQAYDRVEKQLKRYREKLKDHHKHGKAVRKGVEKISREVDRAEGEPEIIRSRAFCAPEPLFLEDASQQLRDSAKQFLVFQNASTQKVSVIFKREDGNHGLVEPGF